VGCAGGSSRTTRAGYLLSLADRLGKWVARKRRERANAWGHPPNADFAGPTRFYVSRANGHSDFRKAAGARRYASGVVRRYQPVVRSPAALPRRPAAPLRWARLAVTGLQVAPRRAFGVLRGILRLLLDESATSSRTQRVITDASIRHNMPIHTLSGYGASDLN